MKCVNFEMEMEIGIEVPLTEEEKTSLVAEMTKTFYDNPTTQLSDYMSISVSGMRINIQQLLFLIMSLTVNPYDITEINFTTLVLTNEFVENMAYYLLNNMLPNISQIILGNNKAGDFLAASIANVFQFNPYLLQKLEMYGNQITDDGAIKIAKSLKDNTSLLGLNLNCNNIGDAGAIALAEFLVSNTTLEYFSLAQNQISDIGFELICKALKVNKTLLGLTIDHNNEIMNWGLLIPALEDNFVIHVVNIDEYRCEPETLKKIHKLLKRNRNLYENQYWLPWRHMSFPSESMYREHWLSKRIYYSCHNIIISSIICGDEFSVWLPMEVWKYIFSFFRRNKFMEIS